MAMDRLSLARFLELLQLPQPRRLKLIERDARKALYEERFGKLSDGGDFYGPFWADAKRSAVDRGFCLKSATDERISSNKSRRRLYPHLLEGFETGWTSLKASSFGEAALSLVMRLAVYVKGSEEEDHIRATNVLAVTESDRSLHITYPYFSKDVKLGMRHARLGLGVLRQGFATAQPKTVAILDVLHGSIYIDSGEDIGDPEHKELVDRYDAVMREWRAQKRIHRS
jgi:hypothetical protein